MWTDVAIHGFIEECNNADLVFFGSGLETRNLITDKSYLDRFKLNPDKQIICSMCSGALIIAAPGHLKGLSATTYPTAFEILKSYGVEVIEDSHLVTHGNIGTAAACLAAVDLIGWAIEKMYNEQVRQDVIASVLPNATAVADKKQIINSCCIDSTEITYSSLINFFMRNRLFFPFIVIAMTALLNYQALNAQKTWNLSGNSNASVTSKLGTTNSIPLRVFTNNVERIHIDVSGNVGIGTTNPADKLHVEGIGLFTQGISASNGGIIGYNTGGVGLYGEGTTYGVYAVGRNFGVLGSSNNGGHGVDGWSSYLGVYGNGGTYGVYGAGGTYGVYGAGSAYGVYGNNSNGIGIVGNSTNYLGGYFYSTNYYGIRAGTGLSSKNWAGVFDGNLLAFGTYQTSDKNLKKNIEDITDALSIINKLKPRSYEFRKEGKLASLNLPQGKHYGLIAQDLEEVLPDLVKEVENAFPPNVEPKPVLSPEPNGKDVTLPPPAKETVTPAPQQLEKSEKMTVKAVNYIELIPILIKALQDQQQQINELKQTVSKFTQPQSTNASAGSEMLGQNIPNPVRDVTKIQFGLPQGSNNAQLVITDNLGRVVKSLRLTASGMVNVDVSSFGNGVYNYSLVIDNKTLQTRKMTVVK